MPAAPDNHDAYDYAERIRERLPRRLQKLADLAQMRASVNELLARTKEERLESDMSGRGR